MQQTQGKYSITFMMGKSLGLVPVQISKECEAAMEVLADSQNRADAGINPSDNFLFAYTQMSDDGSIGYNEIIDI